jgi:hypothetical protein
VTQQVHGISAHQDQRLLQRTLLQAPDLSSVIRQCGQGREGVGWNQYGISTLQLKQQ